MNELVVSSIVGQCPMQGQGSIGTKRWYFRAHDEHWQFILPGPYDEYETVGSFAFSRDGSWGLSPEAGYMPVDEAMKIIRRCADEYVAEAEARQAKFKAALEWTNKKFGGALKRLADND